MGIVDTLLGKVLGNKADRDLKEIQPIVDQIIEVYPDIKKLSDDGLRNKTFEIKGSALDIGIP